MMNIVTMGSCLSRYLAVWLVRDFGIPMPLNQVMFMTSDQIIKYFVDKSLPVPPMEVFDRHIVYEPEHQTYVSGLLRFMQAEYLGLNEFTEEERAARCGLLETLATKKVDLFLCDNLFELTSVPYYLTTEPEFANSPVTMTPWLCKNFRELNRVLRSARDTLSPAESAQGWVRVLDWFRAQQPEARFVFSCCPSSTSRVESPERAARADAFHGEFLKALNGRNVEVLPPWEVPADLTIEKDWTHFDDKYYRSIAGYLYMTSRLGRPIVPG